MRAGSLALAALLLASTAFAQQHPNLERGFMPEKMYDFSAIDSVNTFNGDLMLHIPIGDELRANGVLPYQLTLVYNSLFWEYIDVPPPTGGDSELAPIDPDGLMAIPSNHSNAGMGWSLTLGHLLTPGDTMSNAEDTYSYVSPDSGEHPLHTRLHDETPSSTFQYTRDSSYTRYTEFGAHRKTVELANGTIQTFKEKNPVGTVWPDATDTTNRWRLTNIADRFGNNVDISYGSDATYTEIWTITDEPRTTTVYFRKDSDLVGGTSYFNTMVDHIDIPKFGGGTPATWQFHYAPRTMYPGAGDSLTNGMLSIAMLTSITLPSGQSYSMTYIDGASVTPGVLSQLTLPTGGNVQWTYEQSVWDDGSWEKSHAADSPKPPVVQTRSYGGGTWTYGRFPGTVNCKKTCNNNPNCSFSGNRQLTAWVTGPDNVSTLSYFSTYTPGVPNVQNTDRCAGSELWAHEEYGLPFTRSNGAIVAETDGKTLPPDSGLNGNTGILTNPTDLSRYLSTEVRTGFTAPVQGGGWNGFGQIPNNGTLLRSTWVTYDHDNIDMNTSGGRHDVNPRMTSSLTRFEDDASCNSAVCYSGARSFGFDNFGHFRQSSSLSNFSGSANYRTSFTNYDTTLDTLGDWVLGTYSEQCMADEQSQRVAPPDLTTCGGLSGAASAQVNVDRHTGALLGKRTSVNFVGENNPATHDLLAVFEYDNQDHGLVSREKYYGGDFHPLSSSSGFTTSSSLDYELDHTYTFGNGLTKVQSSYADAGFLTEDVDLDPYTGRVSGARDSAGLATTLSYDSAGRLTQSAPPGTQPTIYTYSAAGVTPVTVTAETTSADTTAGKLSTQYEYDPWGRLGTVRSVTYDGVWSIVTTTYDALGRKSSVTTPHRTGSGFPTTYLYDAFGRPTTITAPDGTVTSYTRTGNTSTTRTLQIAQTVGQSDAAASSIEYTDHLGRLIKVDEPSITNSSSNTSTTYTYDVGDRLKSVQTGNQTRTFTYDGRGLLVSESHPEKGLTSYVVEPNSDSIPKGYDARGHARRRVDGNAVVYGPFDLTYDYDTAERLLAVKDFDQSSLTTPKTQRVLKSFTYATSNVPAACTDTSGGNCDARNAKLFAATRYNRRSTGIGDVAVTEQYTYAGRGGRPSARDTTLFSSFPFLDGTYRVSQVFNDLGLPASTTYPAECLDGDCTNLAAPLLTVSRTYKNGFLATITGGGTSYVDGITYQANGLISTVEHHNGTNENWTPDIHGMSRPCSITLTVPGVIQNNASDSPCSNQSVFWTTGAYGYDGAGNIKYINFTPYTYDKVSRLTQAGGETFTYDVFGNITNHTGSTISVDSNTNRLAAGATYDAAGNLATWNDPADSSTRTVTYDWDALGSLQHLTDKGTVTPNPRLGDGGTGSLDKYHVYTADDERVASVDIPLGQYTAFPIISLRYTLRGFGNELLSTFTLGTASDGWQALYRTENDIWRGSQLAAIDTPTGIQHFALDHLGSPRVITDASGNVLSQPAFAPFGTGGVTGTTALQFTGHERDSAATADTLDYMHARFYTPGLGRFLSVDTVIGSPGRPQSWNRFAYTRNNPLLNIDRDGRVVEVSTSGNYQVLEDTIVATLQRPDGRAAFGAVAADPTFTNRWSDAKITPEAVIQFQFHRGNTASIVFGSTESIVTVNNGKAKVTGADTKIDTARIGIYHSDKTGVTTAAHELHHVQAARTGGDPGQGDLPSSQSGPAEKEGQRIAAQKPDLTRQEAQQVLAVLKYFGYVRIVP